ncbi:MAG TPA: hypothetical protein VFE96_03880, partial [Candidatus Bathyarchaeia archaeon]|nr:hypothetical protein [Candidatus Bathyarchaeia archaeon]
MRKPFSTTATIALMLASTFLAVPVYEAGVAVASASGVFHPNISDWYYLSSSLTPPSQAACNAAGRRCFNPAAMAVSYDYASLLAAGNQGQGKTIALVDSFGSSTIRTDLNVFDNAFGLPHLCGEDGVTCTTGMPTFTILEVQGSPPPTPPPPNSGTGVQNHNLWALEVSLDVEWAHATAPKANILLVTTPTAETLGVPGLPQMMNAIQFVADNHLADVISMSFATGEGAFNGGIPALLQLHQTFVAVQADHVTAFASSGDSGTANTLLTPILNPALIPYPSVEWPASDPLVTAVGGTYLCTNPIVGSTMADDSMPPGQCTNHPGLRETGWIPSGGGYSIVFSKPDYQNVLPPGSTFVGSSVGAPGPNTNMRGIPDISYQASARTGVLVYMSEGATTTSGTGCGGANPCSIGWYVVGG